MLDQVTPTPQGNQEPPHNPEAKVETEEAPPAHTGIKALILVASHHSVPLTVERILHEYAMEHEEASRNQILKIAKDNGLKAKSVKVGWSGLAGLGEAYPALAKLKNGNWVVFSGLKADEEGEALAIIDPLADKPGFIFLTRQEIEEVWSGEVVLVKRTYKIRDLNQPFGLRWFIPEIFKQSRSFGYVALAALTLHLIALVTPFFFQIVIDKVLVHESRTTLFVLTIGVIGAIFFDAILSFLRNFLLLFATNKIDVRLSSRTFDHLMKLPINFFEQSSAGVLTKHMQQTESIREFMTGKVFMTALDATALFVFVPILLVYNLPMAAIIILFSVIVAGIVFAIMPVFRRNLQYLYEAEGERQAMLVETIHGMRTVKALAIEPHKRKIWNNKTAEAVNRQFAVGKISTIAGSLVGFIEKLSTVAVVFFGALFVFQGTLTVGELVAIQMIAGRVSGPLVQMVSLVNEFQQTSLSIRMLAEVMNRKPEAELNVAGLAPDLKGNIAFENVSFYYPGSSVPALDQITLGVREGSVVGVVGRSGSGKTTFTRLLQGLYFAQNGLIRFDGHDIREIDLAHLRRSIGVVIQESFLFRGTVRENIAAGKPDATFTEIVEAAHLAGADEFIQRLPQGYETVLEENASNLSGGQKQRLSIARSLLPQPRIMIFDEATSALDPESEAIVQANLSRIAEGRTLFIVSHRLSTLTDADAIVVFDQGKITDVGSHPELLQSSEIYQQLWGKQTRHLSHG